MTNTKNVYPPRNIDTPRWGSVRVTVKFPDSYQAALAGFTESTGRSDVKGKLIESKVDENGHGWCEFQWAIIGE